MSDAATTSTAQEGETLQLGTQDGHKALAKWRFQVWRAKEGAGEMGSWCSS